MKKYSIYIGTLVVGLLLGWLLFGGSQAGDQNHDHDTAETENHMWTCSMHPQIMQAEFGDCPICGMELIPAEASAEGLAADQFKLTENALALANIETTVIGSEEDQLSTNSLMLSGTIIANQKATAIQAAHFGGRIEKLYFKSEGELVKQGALIASIYSPELVTAQNELIEALAIKEAQPELYNAVRNKLKYWKISEEQIQILEQTKKVITNFKMHANTTGYIEKFFVEEGNHVKEGASLFSVTNLNTVWANFDVYEQDIKNLKMDQTINISLNAYSGKAIKAKIDYIDPVLDTATRTVSVRATLKNTDAALKPGMLLSGQIELKSNNEESSSLSIPKTAVLWTGKRSIVYIKASKDIPVFELREVNLGNSVGSNYIVLSGLNNGEEIVTNGTFTIDAAAQLQGKKSMMNTKEEPSASSEELTNNKHDETNASERLEVSIDFQKELKRVFDSYIILKNALVADQASEVQNNAKQLGQVLSQVDMKLLSDATAHKAWMSLEKELKSTANSIANTTDIKIQRDHFINLSNAIINGVNSFGINQEVYTQFCPMADANKGASWLSTEKIINNPYFGASMLKCGSITQTIQ